VLLDLRSLWEGPPGPAPTPPAPEVVATGQPTGTAWVGPRFIRRGEEDDEEVLLAVVLRRNKDRDEGR